MNQCNTCVWQTLIGASICKHCSYEINRIDRYSVFSDTALIKVCLVVFSDIGVYGGSRGWGFWGLKPFIFNDQYFPMGACGWNPLLKSAGSVPGIVVFFVSPKIELTIAQTYKFKISFFISRIFIMKNKIICICIFPLIAYYSFFRK